MLPNNNTHTAPAAGQTVVLHFDSEMPLFDVRSSSPENPSLQQVQWEVGQATVGSAKRDEALADLGQRVVELETMLSESRNPVAQAERQPATPGNTKGLPATEVAGSPEATPGDDAKTGERNMTSAEARCEEAILILLALPDQTLRDSNARKALRRALGNCTYREYEYMKKKLEEAGVVSFIEADDNSQLTEIISAKPESLLENAEQHFVTKRVIEAATIVINNRPAVAGDDDSPANFETPGQEIIINKDEGKTGEGLDADPVDRTQGEETLSAAARCEKAILLLFDLPDQTLQDPNAGRVFRDMLGCTYREYEYMKKKLEDAGVVSFIKLPNNSKRTETIRLELEALLANAKQRFVTERVTKAATQAVDNMTELAENEPAQPELESPHRIPAIKLEPDSEARDLPHESPRGVRKIEFEFEIAGKPFHGYTQAREFARFIPLRKLLLSIGQTSRSKQGPRQRKDYLLRMLNTNMPAEEATSLKDMGQLVAWATEQGYIEESGEEETYAYELQEKAIAVLNPPQKKPARSR